MYLLTGRKSSVNWKRSGPGFGTIKGAEAQAEVGLGYSILVRARSETNCCGKALRFFEYFRSRNRTSGVSSILSGATSAGSPEEREV